MSKYAKFWTALVFAALIAGLTALESALTDGIVSGQEMVTIALALCGAVMVYAVPNKEPDAD